MRLFTSNKERRLWLLVLTVLVAIYSTLRLAGVLAQTLNETVQAGVAIATLPILIVLVVVGIWMGWRPNRAEIGVWVGIISAYTMAMIRMTATPAERTHLFEYGIVAVFVHQALLERQANGQRVPLLAVLAVVITAIFGFVDELIQAFLPNRVYDLRDVGFNALAAVMAIGASVALAWARRRVASG